MQQTNLIYVFNPQWQVLLCAKKKSNSGFEISLGKRNGAGGKLEEGETMLQAAKRELEEETGIVIPEEAFELRGINKLYYENKPERNQEVHVFVIQNYTGEYKETEELFPQWFPIDAIPYEKMWADDIHWMPRMFAGEYFEYTFHFTEDGKEIVSHEKLK